MSEDINDSDYFGDKIVRTAKEAKFFGRMNDPSASAGIRGLCGDEMEFYLIIEDDKIEDIKFYTDGCLATRACGEMTASFAIGKNVEDALGITPKEVMRKLDELPEDHRHCSILAVSTLFKAIADYLLKD